MDYSTQPAYKKQYNYIYSKGYTAGYKKHRTEAKGDDGIGDSLLRERAVQVGQLKAHRLILLAALVGTWIGILLNF